MIRWRDVGEADALCLARCAYAALTVCFWPFKSPRWLAELGTEHFHPPLGPFSMADGYPGFGWVVLVEVVVYGLFALWVTGRGGWVVGASLTAGLTLLSGFCYAAGKIDHDFVILLAPLLLSVSGISPQRSLMFCVGMYFASSGMAKVVGHWLDPGTQASLSWALQYYHGSGKEEFLLRWSLENLPGWAWEVVDQLTVLFELAVPLGMLPRFRKWIVLSVPLFHFGTVLVFGIDFARLMLVYVPLALVCWGETKGGAVLELGRRGRWIAVGLCWLGVVAALLHLWLRGRMGSVPLPVQPPGLLLFPLFELLVLGGMILRRRSGKAGAYSGSGT
ncbi:MAG: hypothetical protein O3A87_01410 [Verrucomicrobia bacterium]|nr:hypothetical protein [Verrucomicrobiota bacterium]MDA1005127.1 hypothetical protein [Verrucomicrobiota bacterium]